MKSCCLAGLLEDLALVELPSLGIGALPLEVLGHQLFALVRGGVQLAPTEIQRILKISVADPGCLSLIPDPTFFHPGCLKELKYFNPKKTKKMVSNL